MANNRHAVYLTILPQVIFMAPDDELIAGILDERWRTVVQIRGRLGIKSSLPNLTATLRRLAAAGAIEKQDRATAAPMRRGKKQTGHRAIEFFRQAQSRSRDHA
jgi:hypothetical protein